MKTELTNEQLEELAAADEFLLYCSQDEFNEIARAVIAADRAMQEAETSQALDTLQDETRKLIKAYETGRAIQDDRHREELAAYELTVSNLRAEIAGRGVPDGWRLVPVVLTAQMLGKFADAVQGDGLDWGAATEEQKHEALALFSPCYRAMLAAAPQPPERRREEQPGGWVMVSTDTLSGWKTQVDTLAVPSGQARRERTIKLKQEIADVLAAAPQPPAQAVDCDKFSEAEITPRAVQDLLWNIRSKILSLPRYSFLSPSGGGVVKVPDRYGKWIEAEGAADLCEVESAEVMAAAAPRQPERWREEQPDGTVVDVDPADMEQPARKPLFAGLIAQHEGLAEELAAQPEQSLCGHCGRQVIGDAWPINPPAQPEPAPTSVSLKKRAELEAHGYVVNGVALMHLETRQRVLLDYCGFVGWWHGQVHHDQQSQAERKPMTRDQVDDLAEDGVFLRSVYEIVREVEAFHGIKDTR